MLPFLEQDYTIITLLCFVNLIIIAEGYKLIVKLVIRFTINN